MRRWLPILALLAGVGSSFSSAFPFHFEVQDQGLKPTSFSSPTTEAAAASLGRECGANLRGIPSLKAFSNGGDWAIVKDLAQAARSAESDFVNTAEAWKIGRAFVVQVAHSELDVGSESTDIYCFDGAGKLEALDSTTMQYPQGEGKPWGIHARWKRRADGAFTRIRPNEFLDQNGKRAKRLKLDDEDRRFADSWGPNDPGILTIEDLKLPKELLR